MSNQFNNIVNNFENSLRGRTKLNNSMVKAFPHVAGSVFISKIVSLLRTIVSDEAVYANLDDDTIKERIYSNGKAIVLLEVLDETVELENMFFVFESFQNISIDTYKGMKQSGKYGNLQKELNSIKENSQDFEEELVA